MNQALLTVDLGFGDAGKGSIVDYLVRTQEAHTVIRYNGGAQAGHRVVEQRDDGTVRDHVFAQFGSGTLAGAATHLSRFMLLEPLAMLAEAQHLVTLGVDEPFARTTIDRRALVITPFQRAANRLREIARGKDRHGSCGMGIGETMADRLAHGDKVLFAGDLLTVDTLRAKLAFLRQINWVKVRQWRGVLPETEAVANELALFYDDAWEAWLLDAYAEFMAVAQIVPEDFLPGILQRPGVVVFEGAQGVLLDEWRGFHPYTTWSTTTLANADQLLAEARYGGTVTRIGISRAYATRHGAGPFVTEDAALTAALPDAYNYDGAWQAGFRVGWLDLLLLRYAKAVVGPLDYLALTCLDRLATIAPIQLCTAYEHVDGRLIEQLAPSPAGQALAYQQTLTDLLGACRPRLTAVDDGQALIAALTEALQIPVGICSYGPTAKAKISLLP